MLQDRTVAQKDCEFLLQCDWLCWHYLTPLTAPGLQSPLSLKAQCLDSNVGIPLAKGQEKGVSPWCLEDEEERGASSNEVMCHVLGGK